jgi:serine/threonine protein kinase
MPPRPPEPLLGSLLGPWRLLERVGAGGNGIVYKVYRDEHPDDGFFALKLAGAPKDPRFEREAELLSRLEHPHVPGLHDTGTWHAQDGREYPYLVMQWVQGVPLYDWARQRQLSSRQVFQLLAQVTRALEATHRHGTHRDVKGDNILVTREGHAVLVDYGCCWYPGARPLTDTAVPPGTRPYRSPQCLRFQYLHYMDPQAHYAYTQADDVYALGVTAYRLVTGFYPPPPTDPECADDPEIPRPAQRLPLSALATVHPVLEALIERMLSEEPAARGSASALAKAFEEAAASAGPDADLLVKPSRSMLPTEKATRPGPPRGYWLRKQAPWLASSAALATAVVLSGVALSHRYDRKELRSELSPLTTDPMKQDAGGTPEAVGLADAGVEESLTSAGNSTALRAGRDWISREMPKEPLDGQRKPPCTPRREEAINGACWVRIGDMQAPCGDDYEWEGRCYMPSLTAPRQPTSDGEQ